MEFPGDLVVKDSAVVTYVAQDRTLVWELPHAVSTAKKKGRIQEIWQFLSWLRDNKPD